MPRLLLPLIAMLATIGTGLLLVRKSVTWGFIDLPDPRKIHTLPTPRTGGMAMVLGGGLVYALFLTLRWLPWPTLPWQTWLAGLGFITVGALDDRFSFHPRQKFLTLLSLSILAASPWILVIRANSVTWLPHAWMASPFPLMVAAILIIFWFMAVPNAVNIEDAVNGYMGGFTLLVMFTLYLRGVDTRVVLGALIGFLLLNWPRAKHFMGDAGSFGCGFFIAEGILQAGGLEHPLLALSLTAPISMDVAMGLIRRRRLKMSFFTPDRATCPHRVLALTNGNVTLTTLLLWLNALVFIYFSHWPLLLFGQTILYAGVLAFLNKNIFIVSTNKQINK